MGKHSGEWMCRGEVWELCLEVEQKDGSKRVNYYCVIIKPKYHRNPNLEM